MEGVRLGSYQLHEELGSGGMGTVYKATVVDRAPSTRVGQLVAVKVLHSHLLSKPGFFKRFLREAEVGMRVVHENVVRTLDVDATEIDGQTVHYLVVEYVHGESLREQLDRDGSLSDEKCQSLLRDIARGLQAIHEAGIVHRDLKPENILITDEGTTKLMDLGIAHLKDEAIRLSQTGQFVGSILYAAPEQFDTTRASLDARTDLYALGLTTFELLTGFHPFHHDDVHVAIRRQLTKEAPRVRETRPDVSRFLDRLVDSLLAKSPTERIATADTLLEILESGEVPERVRRRPVVRDSLAWGAVTALILAMAWIVIDAMGDEAPVAPKETANAAPVDPEPENPPPIAPEDPPEEKPEVPPPKPAPEKAEPPPDPEPKSTDPRDLAATLEGLAAEAADSETALAHLRSARAIYEKFEDGTGIARVDTSLGRILDQAAEKAVESFGSSDAEKAKALLALARLESEVGPGDGKQGEKAKALRRGTGTIHLLPVRAEDPAKGVQGRPWLRMRLTPKPWGLAAEAEWMPRLRWPPGTYEISLLDSKNRAVVFQQEVQIDGGKTTLIRVPVNFPSGMTMVVSNANPPFFIDVNEVTVGEYRKAFPRKTFQWGGDDLPAHGISFREAEAYAAKVGKRLPTRRQWRLAAFGDGIAKRKYPWGDEEPGGRCNIGTRAPVAVGSFPAGRSPFGVNDMAGNVWEWLRADPSVGQWAIGGGYRFGKLEYPIPSGRRNWRADFLRDPKPSEETYQRFREQRKYHRYRVTAPNLSECGFRCVIDLF